LENRLVIDACLVELKPVRRTPFGTPVVECALLHDSMQSEAGVERNVACELAAVAVGDLAGVLSAVPVGSALKASGFLARKNAKSRSPVLHLTQIEILEGTEHGL
jgi:primosomal replication protein N